MKAKKEILEELHGSVALELLRRIRSGEALPADIANSIKFLKDNNIEGLATEGSPLGNLVNSVNYEFDTGVSFNIVLDTLKVFTTLVQFSGIAGSA